MREPKVKTIVIDICDMCLEGIGEMCHTPWCALCRHVVDLPIDKYVYQEVEYDRTKPVPTWVAKK